MRPLAPEQLPTRWPASLLPAELLAGQSRLLTGLLNRVGADGAVRDACRSRILESALTLALVIRHGQPHQGARSRIMRYLERHRHTGNPLEAALADTALRRGNVPVRHEMLAEMTARVPEFAGVRKRALLHAVFIILGADPAYDTSGPDAFAVDALHPWAAVQVTAVKAVLGRAAGKAPLGAGDLALLASTQRRGIVWEGNLFIHLLVLHALADVPGMQATVDEGLGTALMYQRDDGGMPFVTDTDTWSTVTAGLALHAAGAPRRVLHRVGRHLRHVQHEDGGWSYTDRAQLPDTDCTTVALEFLHQLDPYAYRDPIRRGLDALLAVRGADGGFPTYGAGTPSEACMTAAAVNALSTQRRLHHGIIQSALHFLAGSQLPDGSFPPGWSSSRLHTLFRAHLAANHSFLTPPSPIRDMNERILSLVLAAQRADGGFGQQEGSQSDAISTSYGLIILTGQGAPAPAARATRYLLAQLHHDSGGGITSPPDILGPRPFPYHVPVLADAFALLALGHLSRRIRPCRAAVPRPSAQRLATRRHRPSPAP
ncbi:terpene cyclase/mutase family protein [Streptomyces sp. NBC_01728]|uniref:prenyltransferase/squalene oxidase repeat-containing protein n=1 Tax=unclassified Streptomyces TaxID=2593676 RepID=UPI002259B522|nr:MULTISPECIES: prenyltransferase/squalene oxidase repeat-containing protein [unclassified Streptomyces]MCX4461263.1 terpene cyclase/mutase family protein [Streptomyces sp. NBC_01719]MCX4490171.1 terpene cyclase/mutase family protein [Streptomyces sp. NBC_01728]